MSKKKEYEINELFRALIKLEGSDLHLKVDQPPIVRIKGELQNLDRGPIGDEEMARCILAIMDQPSRKILADTGGADFTHQCDVDGVTCHFRVNVFQQMGRLGMVARRIEHYIPPPENLHVLPILYEFCKLSQGMILLAGVADSWKSETMALMLDWINRNDCKHILTQEDSIEFPLTEDKCLINRREIGKDVCDLETGLKYAEREDFDVLFLGEIRDRKTFQTAIHISETGRLVFGTICTPSVYSAISHILDFFPSFMHKSVRSALAFNMKGIVAQTPLPSGMTDDSPGPAFEILAFNATVRKLILEEKDEILSAAVRIGELEKGQDFTAALQSLIRKKKDESDRRS